jgi:hypothetical protein
MNTLDRKLHRYKLEFTKYSKAYRFSLIAKEDSDQPDVIEKDIQEYRDKAEHFKDKIVEVKEQINKEWKQASAKRRAVDPKLMGEFYKLKSCFFDCKKYYRDYNHFNLISDSDITEEEYKELLSIRDFADLMRALKIMAENKINK